MKKKLLVLLFSLTSLALVSCGGGNDGASTGNPVVAQATIASTVAACNASGTYGGGDQSTGPLLSATTNPTLEACIAAMPGIAYGNPWSPGQNGGCLESVTMAPYIGFPYGYTYATGNSSRYGPPLTTSAKTYCFNLASYCCTNYCPNPVGSQQAQNAFCAYFNSPDG